MWYLEAAAADARDAAYREGRDESDDRPTREDIEGSAPDRDSNPFAGWTAEQRAGHAARWDMEDPWTGVHCPGDPVKEARLRAEFMAARRAKFQARTAA